MGWRCHLFFSLFLYRPGICGNMTNESSQAVTERESPIFFLKHRLFPTGLYPVCFWRMLGCDTGEGAGGSPLFLPWFEGRATSPYDDISAWCFCSVSGMKSLRMCTQMVHTGLCSAGSWVLKEYHTQSSCEGSEQVPWPSFLVPPQKHIVTMWSALPCNRRYAKLFTSLVSFHSPTSPVQSVSLSPLFYKQG